MCVCMCVDVCAKETKQKGTKEDTNSHVSACDVWRRKWRSYDGSALINRDECVSNDACSGNDGGSCSGSKRNKIIKSEYKE
jgi:hypothetical protein